jgi:hypothetical protein
VVETLIKRILYPGPTNIQYKENWYNTPITCQGKIKYWAPPSILEHYSKVTVGIYVMHVNGTPYLINTAKHLKFIQCICIRNKSDAIYVAAIKKMDAIYKLRGFKITTMYADRAFEHCKEALAVEGIDLIWCDANAHVHFVERCIRFIKERIRGV